MKKLKDLKELKELKNIKKKKLGTRILLAIVIVIIALLGTFYGVFLYYYNKTNFVKSDEQQTSDYTDPETDLTEEEEEQLRNDTEVTEDPLLIEATKSTYNILLIGADRRDSSWNGNSDTMILMTMNQGQKKIYMTSFMRDLYADIPGYGIHKMNYSYAVGGASLLINVLENNYGVRIDNYAAVDFQSMTEIVDVMGGVDIEIKDYELTSMKSVGITTAGMHHLNGEQALTYMRIRHQGNADFERTSRQRTVLTALMDTARSMNYAELAAMADKVLPYLTHDLDQATVLSQMTKIPEYLSYDVEQLRIPEDGTWYSVNEILVPYDINAVIRALREKLYG